MHWQSKSKKTVEKKLTRDVHEQKAQKFYLCSPKQSVKL
jgi:hypothetical protein